MYGAAFAEEFADARGFGWSVAVPGAGGDGAPGHDWSALVKLKVGGSGQRTGCRGRGHGEVGLPEV